MKYRTRDVRQDLKIKSFPGTNRNAVLRQIPEAMIPYRLLHPGPPYMTERRNRIPGYLEAKSLLAGSAFSRPDNRTGLIYNDSTMSLQKSNPSAEYLFSH